MREERPSPLRRALVILSIVAVALTAVAGLVAGYVAMTRDADPVAELLGEPLEKPEPREFFPTLESTGPRIPVAEMEPVESILSEKDGQLIEGVDVASRIKIVHDDVVVRDVRITHTAQRPGQYAVLVEHKSDGTCPEGVVLEHVEVRGDTDVLAPGTKAVYGACPFTLRNSQVHDVATGVRITNGSVLEGNFIHASHFEEGDDAHRSAIGLNGGKGHRIVGNTILCEGPGCSGALVIYGDFARPEDVLVEDNLLATTGSYCTYAGSLDSKKFPVAKDVRYVGNTFGREFFPTCGRYGPVAGLDGGGGPGFRWERNTWDDGEELRLG